MGETSAGVSRGGFGGPQSGPRWSTSSFGHSTDTSPVELQALGEHLQHCQNGSRLHALQRGAQAVHRFTAPRLVSTLSLAVALGGAAVLVLL
jgi:hypothetical protein